VLNNFRIKTFILLIFVISNLNLLGQEVKTGVWKLIWYQNPVDDSVTYYHVYRDTTEDIIDDVEHLIYSKNTNNPLDDPDTVFIDTVDKGKEYFYKLKAENKYGKSEFSAPASAAFPLITFQDTLGLPENYLYRINLNVWVRDPDSDINTLSWFVDDSVEYSNEGKSLRIEIISNPDSARFLTDSITWQPQDMESVNFTVIDADSFDDSKILNVKYSAEAPLPPPMFLKKLKANDAEAWPLPFDATQHEMIRFVNLPLNSNIYIYNILGELVFEDDIGNNNQYLWNVRNKAGKKIQTGLYLYVIESGKSKSNKKKIVIIR
jgi:hypothetical protein